MSRELNLLTARLFKDGYMRACAQLARSDPNAAAAAAPDPNSAAAAAATNALNVFSTESSF